MWINILSVSFILKALSALLGALSLSLLTYSLIMIWKLKKESLTLRPVRGFAKGFQSGTHREWPNSFTPFKESKGLAVNGVTKNEFNK
jgi:hypothetical protein